MKNIKQIIEELKEEFPAIKLCKKDLQNDRYNDGIEGFIKQSITELLASLQDDDSLEDESNGRCNREFELRSKINKILI